MEISKGELSRTLEENFRSDLDDSPLKAAFKDAVLSVISSGLVFGSLAYFTGETRLYSGMAVMSIVSRAFNTFKNQAALQKTYKDLTTMTVTTDRADMQTGGPSAPQMG